MNPKISFVMPFYNNKRYLADAIESVLSTAYLNYELILVDDASTDGSKNIALRYLHGHPNISLVSHSVNQGPAKALKTALLKAKGKYIIFSAADDITYSERANKIVNCFEQDSNVGIVVSHANIIDENDVNTGEVFTVPKHFEKSTAFSEQLKRNYCLGATLAIKNAPSIYNKNGFLELIDDYQISLEYLLEGYMIDIIREPLLSYRVHPESVSSKRKSLFLKTIEALKKYDSNELMEKMLKKDIDERSIQLSIGIFELFRNCQEEAYRRLKDIYSLENNEFELCFYLGVICYQKREYSHALRYWEEAFHLNQYEPTVLNNLGVLHIVLDVSDLKNSRAYLFKALELQVGYIDAKNNLDNLGNGDFSNMKITERLLQTNIIKRENYLGEEF